MQSVVHAQTAQEIQSVGQASWLRPPRTDQAEMLDLNAGSIEDVRANLREMWLINRWLGGLRALTVHLFPRLRAASATVSVLDLGTGGAEVPAFLTHWAAKHQIALQVIGVDWSPRNLAVAHEIAGTSPNIQLLRADASHLPLPENSVDYVISSLFMHHFTADEVVHLLRGSYRCARHGIIMSDLVRGWLPLFAFKLIHPIFARNWLTRHDGALSIYRAYTPDEMRRLADEAGLPHVQISSHWPWRMTVIADKDTAMGHE